MKRTVITITAAIALACSAFAQTATLPKTHVYTNPTGNEFPILAWYSVLPVENCTHERYQELADAGFNISFSHFSKVAEMDQALKNSKGTGVKTLVACKELETNPAETAKHFKGQKDIAGYFFQDEPNTTGFDKLAQWVNKVRAVDDTHMLYLNLLPNYASPEMLVAKDWKDYAEKFVDKVGLGMVSYDFYPVVNENGSVHLRELYYKNFEDAYSVAKAANQPLWAFALSTAHRPYPVATREMLRLEIFSALAYGAQGIQYFTYWAPSDTTVWNFHNSPIDAKGQRTEVYDLVSQVNHEVQHLAWVFLGCKVTDVAHTGDKIPAGTHALTTLPSAFSSIKASGEGVIVSQLQNGNNHFLMIVNRSLDQRQQVTVAPTREVNRVMPCGKTVKASLYNNSLWLDPGSYLLYQWTE
jgi:hypothetical protein